MKKRTQKMVATKKRKATQAKMEREIVGKGEAAQVIRMISQRIDYLRIHSVAGPLLALRTSSLEQIAMTVMRTKFR